MRMGDSGKDLDPLILQLLLGPVPQSTTVSPQRPIQTVFFTMIHYFHSPLDTDETPCVVFNSFLLLYQHQTLHKEFFSIVVHYFHSIPDAKEIFWVFFYNFLLFISTSNATQGIFRGIVCLVGELTNLLYWTVKLALSYPKILKLSLVGPEHLSSLGLVSSGDQGGESLVSYGDVQQPKQRPLYINTFHYT